MKTKTRVLGMFMAAGLAMTPALAIPPALDHVSPETPVVIGVRDLTHLVSSAKHWAGMFAPEEAMGGFQMAEMMLTMPGVNAAGSAAVAMAFDENQPEPIPVLIVPVTDYTEFVEGMQGEMADGVTTIQIMGEDAYAKNVGGGFVALSPDFDAVSGFDGAEGRLSAHEARLGKTAKAAADKADLFMIVDVQSMRPYMEMGLQEMEQNMAMAAMMGGEAVQAQIDMMMNAAKSVVNDGRTAFLGMGSGDAGLWLDFAAQFADGSDTGGTFAESGNAGALMKQLPSMDYIAAFAFDMSSEGIRNIMEEAAKLNQGMSFGGSMGQLAELQSGQSMVIGTTPGLFAGGLFANTVAYTASKNPTALLDGYKTLMAEMNGQTQEGLKFSTTFEENAAASGDTPLHAYAVSMEVDPNDENAMMASMAMQQMAMVFGGEAGPRGYIALTDDGMYQTMSRNSALVAKALAHGESISTNAGISNVAEHLPRNRTAEAYINIKGVTDMIAPMLAMMGGVELPDLPENMHPIGMSLSTGAGGMHGRLFMPADVLQMISSLMAQFGSQDEWEMEEEPDSKPRF